MDASLTIENWQGRIAAEPLSARAWLGFARASFQAGKLRDGFVGFRVAAQYGKADSLLAREVAIEAAQAGLWTVATDVLEAADPADEAMALLMADALFKSGHAGRSRQISQRLLVRDPASLPAILLMANAERRADRAAPLLHEALAKYPHEGAVVVSAIEHFLDQGRFDQASRLLDEAHDRGLRDPSLFVVRGRIAEHSRNHGAAAEFYRQALAANPNCIDALLPLGRLCLKQLAAPHESARLVHRLLTIEPMHSAGTVLFADVAEARGAVATAIERLTEFHGAVPADHRVALRLVRLLAAVGEGAQATAIASEIVVNRPRGRAFTVDLATARASAGDWAGAIDDLHKEFRGVPTAELVRHVTRVFEALPDTASEVLFINAVVARWQVVEFVVQMISRARNAAQVDRALAWAQALVRATAGQLPASAVEVIAAVAEAGGRIELLDECLAAAPREARSLALKRDIQKMAERRDFAEARSLVAKALKDSPSDIAVRLAHVRLLVQFGQLPEAEKAAENARRQVSDSADVVRAKFELALIRGRDDEAIDVATRLGPISAARFASEADLVSLALGEALRQGQLDVAGKLADSVASVVERLMLLPHRQPIVVDYLRLIGRLGEMADLSGLVRKAIAAGYNRGRMFDVLAEHLVAAGDFEAALSATREALEHGNDTFERRRRHAQLLLRFGRWAEAVAVTNALLLDRPSAVAVMQLHGQALAGVERFDEAESMLRLAVAETNGRIDYLHGLATFLRRRGTLETEIARLRAHAVRFPRDVTAKLHLAVCLYHNGELADADTTLDAMSASNRYNMPALEFHVSVRYLRMDYGGALDLVATADSPRITAPARVRRISAMYRQVFDYSGSARPLRRATDAGVSDASVLLGLLENSTEWGNPVEAMAAAERVIDRFPLEPRAYFFKGVILHQTGDIEGARIALRTALFLRPSDTTSQMQLGLISEELGNFEGALSLYNETFRASSLGDRKPSPRTLWHRFLVYMILGRVPEAAEAHRDLCHLYEEVFPSHLTIWRGEPLEGKTLAIALRGGPGDELRLATMCLPRLLEQGVSKCTFACDPRLYSLLKRTYPEVDFVPTFSGHRQLRRDDGEKSPAVDRVWPGIVPRVTEMAVPFEKMAGQDFVCHSDRLFHETYVEATLRQGQPVRHRFLSVDTERRQQMRRHLRQLGPKPKVGLCWRGSFINRYRRRGYFEVDEIGAILAVKDVTFIDLQVNQTTDETRALQEAGVHAIPGLNLYDDFEGVAALISELDLVLAPGVTIREVASAVNVPSWSLTVIPGASDVWRKTEDRRDRWFPSITHYDLLSFHTRDAVIAKVAGDLQEQARSGALDSRGKSTQAAE